MAKLVKPNEILGNSFENRKAAFIGEVDKIGDKHMIAIVPRLAFRTDGILPIFTFLDKNQPKKASE